MNAAKSMSTREAREGLPVSVSVNAFIFTARTCNGRSWPSMVQVVNRSGKVGPSPRSRRAQVAKEITTVYTGGSCSSQSVSQVAHPRTAALTVWNNTGVQEGSRLEVGANDSHSTTVG